MKRDGRGRAALLLAALALLQAGCATTRYVSGAAGPQAFYQTSWPLHDTSRQLEEIFRSVKRIQVTGYYQTYHFAAEDRITRADLADRATLRRARDVFTFDHAKAGTATAVRRQGGTLQLLTNAHVTRLPDTVFSYYDTTGVGARHVESVAVLRTRANVILGVPGASQFRVVAADSAMDVALISVDMDAAVPETAVPVLRLRSGDAARLSWGSFVYVLGYPRGHAMVTRAIVSSPRVGPDNSFLMDGLFNRGISGGLIVAVRGDTGQLEWVGLAMGASANVEQLLVPEHRVIEEHGILLPYSGRLFIEETRRIDYGITFSVPSNAVNRFLRTTAAVLPDGGR
jgi:hypothetical protein